MVMRVHKNILVILVFFGGCIVLLYFLMFAPSELEQRAGYREVLQRELPEGVYCIAQRLNTSGRERRMYDYRIVFGGNSVALMEFQES